MKTNPSTWTGHPPFLCLSHREVPQSQLWRNYAAKYITGGGREIGAPPTLVTRGGPGNARDNFGFGVDGRDFWNVL